MIFYKKREKWGKKKKPEDEEQARGKSWALNYQVKGFWKQSRSEVMLVGCGLGLLPGTLKSCYILSERKIICGSL